MSDVFVDRTFLEQLYEDIATSESTLGDPKPIAPGSRAAKELLDTQVSFGNPEMELVLLTESMFTEAGLVPSEILKGQEDELNNYYFMLYLNIREGDVRFKKLQCDFTFSDLVNVVRLFPDEKWVEFLKLDLGMKLGLDASLNFAANVDLSHTKIPANLKGQIGSENAVKILVSTNDFSLAWKDCKISNSGLTSNKGTWIIETDDLKRGADQQFITVFKTSIGTTQVDLRTSAFLWIDEGWFREFKQKCKNFIDGLKPENKEFLRDNNEFYIGFYQDWELQLPQPPEPPQQ